MKVSIVTPSYNQGKFVERTLLSVLQQDYDDLEYIVVDGESCDCTKNVLEAYHQSLDRLIVEADDGQADAVRKGLAICSGEILGFLNSDDVLLPGTVEFVSQFFVNNPDVDAVYSNRIELDENDEITGFWILPRHSNYCMSRWDFIPQETCFWRRSLMEKSGPVNSTFGFALDYDLFVRMMEVGRFKRVNRFLAAFRRHPSSKSTTIYETVGRKEVDRVRRINGIYIRWYDHLLNYAFAGWILGTSYIFKVLALNVIRRRIRLPRPR